MNLPGHSGGRSAIVGSDGSGLRKIDPVAPGKIICLANMERGYLTPPVGLNLLIVS